MFGLFKKKEVIKEVMVNAICEGLVVPIEQVPDRVFANKTLGDGVGFILDQDTIFAPCDGEIIMLAGTYHALGLRLKNGAELLIHIGLDTVYLNGQGLKPKVKKGDFVKQGQQLLEIDRRLMKEKKIDLTTPLLLTTNEEYRLTMIKNNGTVNIHEPILKIERI